MKRDNRVDALAGQIFGGVAAQPPAAAGDQRDFVRFRVHSQTPCRMKLRQSGALKTQSRVLPTAKNIACYIYPGRHAIVNMATPPTRLSHFGMLSAPGGAGHVRTPPVRPGGKRLSKAPNPCCNRTR